MNPKCYKIKVYLKVRITCKDGTQSNYILNIADNCPDNDYCEDRLYFYSNDYLSTNDRKFIPDRSANIEKFTNHWAPRYTEIPQELWMGFLLLIARGDSSKPQFDWQSIKSLHIRYASDKETYENPFSQGLRTITSWFKKPEPTDHKED
jgi:hypothetical protein